MSIRLALVLWTIALVLSAIAGALVIGSDHEPDKEFAAALIVSIGLAFVSSGLVAWVRRPDNGTGRLMTCVGFLWFLFALSAANDPTVFTIGFALGAVPFAAFVHLVLAFPRGYLEWVARWVAIAGYAVVLIAWPATLLVDDLMDAGELPLPENVMLVDARPGLADALAALAAGLSIAVIVAVLAILALRWRRASPQLRRVLAPVYASSLASLVLLGLLIGFDPVSDWDGAVAVLMLAAFLTVPLSYLFALLRGRLARDAERNRALLDAIPDLLFVFSADGTYRDVNAERDELLIAPPDELVGSRLHDVLPRDVADGYMERIGTALRDMRLTRYEYELEFDGRRRSFEARLVPSGPDEVTAIVRDFTEQRQLEDELQARLEEVRTGEARVRALIEAAPAAIVELDLEDRVVSWNRSAERIFGWSSDELLGRHIPIVPPDKEHEVQELRAMARAGGTFSGVDVERLRKDGSRVPVEVSGGPVRDSAGNVLSHMAILVDITERRRLQDQAQTRLEQLQRERDFVRAVVDNTSALFCVVDVEGRIQRFNRAAERTGGRLDDERSRGQRFWDVFLAPEDCHQAMLALADVVAGRPAVEQESDWMRPDGARSVVAWTIVPIQDEYGRQRYLISGADVTERKHQEDELAASRSRIVAAADAERRRLERNLHDGAQQRLVALSLALRLAQGRVRTDPESAGEILEGAFEELQLGLAELRELARGIHPAVLTDRGLGPALETLAGRAPLPVEIAALPEERLPEPVEAAAYYLVSEALTNVARYAQASSVTVRVARENGRAVVEVADDGVGGADPARGSGIRGLADRVAALSGHLEVESPPGRGTRLRAEIPCA